MGRAYIQKTPSVASTEPCSNLMVSWEESVMDLIFTEHISKVQQA